MKRFLSTVLIVALFVSMVACSNQPSGTVEESSSVQLETTSPTAPPETAAPTPTPEPDPYTPMDLFDIEFNPYSAIDFPDNFSVIGASFDKGSKKMEGKAPFVLNIYAEGNMYAAVAYLADTAGLSEQDKNDRFNDYSEFGFCEFVGADGRIITVRQQKPHDDKHENGACLIALTYNVPADEQDRYTALIRDNYNLNALTAVNKLFDVQTDFTECGIGVDLQKNEAVVSVQYYLDDADAIKQRVAENPESEWREWYGLPAADIPYGLIKNTLIFDSRFGAAILVLQSNNEPDSSLGEYVEPEFSLVKFGFGFDDAGVCGVYEEREPHYKSIAIHRPEWGEHPDDWNIEFMDTLGSYNLRITYHEAEKMFRISLYNGDGIGYDYYPETGEHSGHPDNVAAVFNEVFGTSGDEFYDKPLAYFEQFVQERFKMSIDELYALPKQ